MSDGESDEFDHQFTGQQQQQQQFQPPSQQQQRVPSATQQQRQQSAQFARSQPFDEAVEVSDTDQTEGSMQDHQIQHTIQQTQQQRPQSGAYSQFTAQQQQQQQQRPSSRQASGYIQQEIGPTVTSPTNYNGYGMQQQQHAEDEEEEDMGQQQFEPGQLYDSSQYRGLNVSPEINDLFAYIDRYTAQELPLPTPLRPFIPDYIPAVGEIDAFLKVPPPDGTDDQLGLKVLDEPSSHQSDASVLELRLRVLSKHVVNKPVSVASIQDASKHPKKIQRWIDSIEEVHRQKPSAAVQYSNAMPDIEALSSVWPAEFESELQHIKHLPAGDLDMPVTEYAKLVCSLLDIPVYDGKLTESLHVLFTLYNNFKHNAHFQSV